MNRSFSDIARSFPLHIWMCLSNFSLRSMRVCSSPLMMDSSVSTDLAFWACPSISIHAFSSTVQHSALSLCASRSAFTCLRFSWSDAAWSMRIMHMMLMISSPLLHLLLFLLTWRHAFFSLHVRLFSWGGCHHAGHDFRCFLYPFPDFIWLQVFAGAGGTGHGLLLCLFLSCGAFALSISVSTVILHVDVAAWSQIDRFILSRILFWLSLIAFAMEYSRALSRSAWILSHSRNLSSSCWPASARFFSCHARDGPCFPLPRCALLYALVYKDYTRIILGLY